MKKMGWTFAGCTVLGTLLISTYHMCRPIKIQVATFASLLGAFYSFLALIFALCAAVWARASRDLVVSYFRAYFGLENDEREVFQRFAIASNGGRKHLSKDSFLSNASDSKDAEYYLGTLMQKGWIKESRGELVIASDKKILAEQLKG